MAYVEKRVRDKGTVWRARYRDPSGRERSRTFRRKTDAETFLARTPLGRWADRWLDAKRSVKPKTRHGYESLLRTRIKPTFGDVPLNAIRRVDVERWVGAMVQEGLSPSRIRQCHQCLSAMLKAAVREGYLVRNPAEGVDLPRVQRKERRFLDAGQVVELAENMPEEYRALIYVLAYGGLRFGEAAALRRRRCDLLHRRIEIAEAVTEVGGELIWGSPKSHQTATVSLPRRVTEILAAHLDRYVGPDPDAPVFTASDGTPLRHANFLSRTWRPVVELTDLPDDLTPHELRHTCAALYIAQGADPKAIQSQMRHSSIAVTFDVYGHLFPGHLDNVLGALDADHRAAAAERRSEGPGRPSHR